MFVLLSTHGATCVGFCVVTHMCGVEGLARKVGDPIMELVVTCRYEASLLEFQGEADVECHATSITMFQ